MATQATYNIPADGTTDASAALNVLANSTIPTSGGTIHFPAGTYRIGTDLTIPEYVELEFAQGAEVSVDATKIMTINGPVHASLSQIFTGAGTIKFGQGRIREVYPQWWGAVHEPTPLTPTTNSTTALQQSIDSLSDYGGRWVLPHGTYIVTESLVIPNGSSNGRLLELMGTGQAALVNRAPASNPTFKIFGVGNNHIAGLKIHDLMFLGAIGYPNHGIHFRFMLESNIYDCEFLCNGSGVYTDGGSFGINLHRLRFWPEESRYHGTGGLIADVISAAYPAMHIDTPAPGASYCNSMSIRDIDIGVGGNGIKMEPGYSTPMGWTIDRVLAEGLVSATQCYGLDLSGLRSSTINAIYTEDNMPSGSSNRSLDGHIRLNACSYITVMGTTASGTLLMTGCRQIALLNNTMNALEADNTNSGLTIRNLNIGVVGGVSSNIDALELDAAGIIGPSSVPTPLQLWDYHRITRDGAGGGDGNVPGVFLHGGAGLHAQVQSGQSVNANKLWKRWENGTVPATAASSGFTFDNFSLEPDQTYNLPRLLAFCIINTSSGESAQFVIRGSFDTTTEVTDTFNAWSTAKDNSGTLNLYSEASVYKVQNKIGGARDISIFMISM